MLFSAHDDHAIEEAYGNLTRLKSSLRKTPIILNRMTDEPSLVPDSPQLVWTFKLGHSREGHYSYSSTMSISQ